MGGNFCFVVVVVLCFCCFVCVLLFFLLLLLHSPYVDMTTNGAKMVQS